jgi:hypothetical protein
MAYRPSEKQKNATLKDLFRQQTLKNTAKQEDVNSQDLAMALSD